jgi:hypothetical protein
MQMVTLNDDNQAHSPVEGYDSLIWTERYISGDFRLETGNVEKFMNLLPEGQVVSLQDSSVPMLVQTHQIERKKNQPTKLTIVGTDYTSILNRRQAVKAVSAALTEWTVVAKIPSDVAYFAIYKICVEGLADALDVFPADQVQFLAPDDYLTSTGPNREYSITRGNLLTVVQELLRTEGPPDPSTTPATPEIEPHGLRAIRPNSEGTAIALEIYKGVDRSSQIYFDGTRELLDDGTYLFSKEGSATDAYVLGQTNAAKVGLGATGLDRRVILVENNDDGASLDVIKTDGSTALAQAKQTALFDGSINQELNPYLYNVDYGLGDVVKLIGDYGLEERARLTEYIRSEGPDGNKVFATFSTLPDYS